ncbi:hypothetical protein ACFVRD_07565 [Streptomyces sp. NPDC057908]|uniref:hypothetical protein n=1 Tax=Streptomyces sp. NPDC057908 TaxID=3346276 RepID=UPI0036E02822
MNSRAAQRSCPDAVQGHTQDGVPGPLWADDPREISGYVLRGRVGEGGMGTVHLSHTRDGQPVALKVIRREHAQDGVPAAVRP